MSVVLAAALAAMLTWSIVRSLRTRRVAHRGGRVVDIVPECELVSASAVALVAGDGDSRALQCRWERLDARLIELERRATDAANVARWTSRQRSLDQVAAALISLRGALEAAVRLRLDPVTSTTLLDAVDDVLHCRSEDVAMSARVLAD